MKPKTDPDLQALPPEVRDVLALTDRQMQVALGIMRGEVTKAIAARIGCNPRTVEVYRTQIFDRLGANGANDAAVIVASAFAHHWAMTLIRTAIVFGRAYP